MSCVIVLGCFRSGTSAVAGTLHHLGVFMGEKFDEPHKNNPKGFWEDLQFKQIHKKFEEGMYADDWYLQLIESRQSNHELWGVKDPLLCKYLPKLVHYLTTDHKLIVCRRPVEEIAASMGRSIGMPPEPFLPIAKLNLDHMERSLAEYQGPILEINKMDSMTHILEPICNFVGLPSTQAAADFLS